MLLRCHITVNLNIDTDLLTETVKAFGFKSKNQAVNTALAELLRRKKMLNLLDMFGKVDYAPDYDYKKLRSRRPK